MTSKLTSEFYDRFMIGRRSGMTHGAAKKVLVGWRDGWFRSPLAAQMERGDWGTPRKEEDMDFTDGLNSGAVRKILERLDSIADRIEDPALQRELDSVSDVLERKVFGRRALEMKKGRVWDGQSPARARRTWTTAPEQQLSGRCAETTMMLIADEVMKTLSVPTAKYGRGDRVRFNHAGQELTGEVYAEAVADLNRNTLYPVRYGTWLFYVPEKDIVGSAPTGAVPSAVVANTAAVPERAPSRAEAPCPRPGCGKPNDVGVKVCWGCGGDLP